MVREEKGTRTRERGRGYLGAHLNGHGGGGGAGASFQFTVDIPKQNQGQLFTFFLTLYADKGYPLFSAITRLILPLSIK